MNMYMAEMYMETAPQKIPFHSQDGQQLLAEAIATHQTYLIHLFKKQAAATTCGIHSVALLLSARHLGVVHPKSSLIPTWTEYDEKKLSYTEANMFSFKETTKVLDEKICSRVGCNLDQLHSLFLSHGFKASKHYSDITTVETFRSIASKALSHTDSRCGVIVNYDEAALGQDVDGKGHHSPLAGYHHATDRFLLLDTWWNTEEVWVKTGFLYQTMCTVDSGTGKYRGFVLLEE